MQAAGSQAFGSGRARRDAAARAMQGWHSKRLLGSGEVCQPIIKVCGELQFTINGKTSCSLFLLMWGKKKNSFDDYLIIVSITRHFFSY